jgi:hypothetical protein
VGKLGNIKDFMNSAVNSPFSMSQVQTVSGAINEAKNGSSSYGYEMLNYTDMSGAKNSTVNQCYSNVQRNGMSGAWFFAYSFAEGQGFGGWLNHFSSMQGSNHVDDAGIVASAIVGAGNSTTIASVTDGMPQTLPWTPELIQSAKDNFNALPMGSIGRAYMSETEEAAFEGAGGSIDTPPMDFCRRLILKWGGKDDGTASSSKSKPQKSKSSGTSGDSGGQPAPIYKTKTVATPKLSRTIKAGDYYLKNSHVYGVNNNQGILFNRFNDHLSLSLGYTYKKVKYIAGYTQPNSSSTSGTNKASSHKNQSSKGAGGGGGGSGSDKMNQFIKNLNSIKLHSLNYNEVRPVTTSLAYGEIDCSGFIGGVGLRGVFSDFDWNNCYTGSILSYFQSKKAEITTSADINDCVSKMKKGDIVVTSNTVPPQPGGSSHVIGMVDDSNFKDAPNNTVPEECALSGSWWISYYGQAWGHNWLLRPW